MSTNRTAKTDQPKMKIHTEEIGRMGDVVGVLNVFRLKRTREKVYGVRMYRGDAYVGPYSSRLTDLYYDADEAKLASAKLAVRFGIDPEAWADMVGVVLNPQMELPLGEGRDG